LFATATGYGVSFGPAGIDSENLDRVTLDDIQANCDRESVLSEDCVVY